MLYIKRKLDLKEVLSQKSCFLLGPRQVGKSSFIKEQVDNVKLHYNLLHSDVFLKLSQKPELLRQECSVLSQGDCVVIDEIQRIPDLLNEIHSLIEDKGLCFLMSGSSARKLQSDGVNKLGGRARTRRLRPFVRAELKDQFDLDKAIHNGLIPSIYFSDAPDEDLKSYIGDYLTHEVAAEGLTRNIPAFSRFLEVAACCHGGVLNYTKISNDSQVARTTVQEYFQILRDTLIGSDFPVFGKARRRKTLTTSKFYFFDGGLARSLRGLKRIERTSSDWGWGFESYVHHELRSYIDTCHPSTGELSFWRSPQQQEVDFILNDSVAIEVKASSKVQASDLKALKTLQKEHTFKHLIVICNEDQPRIANDVQIFPYGVFLDRLWAGEFN